MNEAINESGMVIQIINVARIVDTVEERAQETYNNGVQGAMIVVQKQSGANSVEISKKVADALPRLQKNLPSDVKIGVIVDTSDNILNTIDSLTETIVIGFLCTFFHSIDDSGYITQKDICPIMRTYHYVCQLSGIIELTFYTQRVCFTTDIEVTVEEPMVQHCKASFHVFPDP